MAYGQALARSGNEGGRSMHCTSGDVDAAVASCGPVLEVRGAVKCFGATTALAGVDLSVLPGEVHALVGRSGAGKSTLVSLLAGLTEPDAGQLRFAGKPAPRLAEREAWHARVACVHRHSTAIRELSVAENIFLNRRPYANGAIDWRTMRRDARALLDRWKIDVHEDTLCSDLSAPALQLVDIARALSQGAPLIVLDEPTAQLDRREIQRLFRRIVEMRREGVTFLFVSHRLHEVYDVCQRVTVLRDGRRILTAPVEIPRQTLIDAMTGRASGEGLAEVDNIAVRERPVGGSAALEISGLAGAGFDAISFAVRRGEAIGLAGASTSGRTELAEAIAGLRKPRSGAIRVHARDDATPVVAPHGEVGAVLVLIDPTLDVDVEIDRARNAGRAVIVASSEPDDLRSCDRVFVMRRGRIVKVFPAFWADHELIAAMEGVDVDGAKSAEARTCAAVLDASDLQCRDSWIADGDETGWR